MKPLRVLSLGAGAQSTCLALMAARGEIEPPEVAIFADTQWEQAVYDHLAWLRSPNVLPFPVNIVTAGNIRDGIRGYKPPPIMHEIRRLLGKGRHDRIAAGAVTVLIGISADEAHRMRSSRQAYIVNSYPLCELRMSRGDCLMWLERHGYPTPPGRV